MSCSFSSRHLLNTARDGNSTTPLGRPFQYLTTLWEKKFFLTSNLNLLWFRFRQLVAISLGPAGCLGEEAKPLPITTSLQEVIECNEVSPEPPLQTGQSQLPQPLFIRLVLQTPHQFQCLSLDMFQGLNIFLVVSGSSAAFLNITFEISVTFTIRKVFWTYCLNHSGVQFILFPFYISFMCLNIESLFSLIFQLNKFSISSLPHISDFLD